MSAVSAQPVGQDAAALALATLQAAYNADITADPHILTTVGNPLRLQSVGAGSIFAVCDNLGVPIFEVADTFVEVDGQFRVVDAFTNHNAQISMTFEDTFTTGVGFIGGALVSSGTITYDQALSIFATFAETKTYRAAIDPGFAAYTVMNVLPRIENAGNFNLVNILGVNMGGTHARVTAGTSVAATTIGFSYASQVQATVAGAIMTRTAQTGLAMSPTFSSVAFSTVNLGTIIGLQLNNPAVAIFQPQLGTENMTAYYGVNINNITFGGAGRVVSGIRSALGAATNVRFLDHTGSATSRLSGQLQFPNDLVGISYGASGDWSNGWGAAGFFFEQQLTGAGGQFRKSFPAVGRMLFDWFGDHELNINAVRFSFGQSGAVGNQVGVFVANARTMTIGGGWSDFLLTQAGNITVDAAASQLFGWTINAPSITLGTGSVVDAGGLLLGGNVSQGTNRYGLLVLSNPAGGTLNYCARFQGAAGVLVDGVLEHAGATLGVFGSAPVAQPTIVGSRGGNAALASLLTLGATLGLWVDGSSA